MRKALALMLIAALAAAGCQSESLVGKPAPDLAFEPLSSAGQKVRPTDFKGKVVLIDFWATWCGPCRDLMPHVQQMADKYGPQGLEVMGVSTEDRATVERFRQQDPNRYPLYLDPSGESNAAYKYDAIPTVVIVARDGSVSDVVTGDDSEAVENAVKKALG